MEETIQGQPQNMGLGNNPKAIQRENSRCLRLRVDVEGKQRGEVWLRNMTISSIWRISHVKWKVAYNHIIAWIDQSISFVYI